MKKKKWIIVFSIIIVAFMACPDTAVKKAEAAKKGITLSIKKKTMQKGNAIIIKCRGTKKRVKWKISNRKIVKIVKKGKNTLKIKARRYGRTVVMAIVGKKKKKCVIVVRKKSGSLNSTTESINEITTEKMTQASSEQGTEVSTEQATEVSTEQVTEVPTEQATEVSTEQETEVSTEQATEVSTEQETEVSTEQVTEDRIETTTEKSTEVVTEEIAGSSALDICDLSDFSSWQTGCYNWTNGKYMESESRICLRDYKTFSMASYKIHITNTDYVLLIRELDKEMQFINSLSLKDGDIYIPNTETVYLGISLYCSVGEYGVNYETYEKMFAEGFEISLEKVEGQDKEEEETVEFTTVREEIKYMLESGGGERNISQYKASMAEVYKIYDELKKDELYVHFAVYGNAYLKTTKTDEGYIETVRMENASPDFIEQYEKVKEKVEDAISYIQPQMDDVEKTVILHDYLVAHTTYSTNTENPHLAVGPLAEGVGVCDGYAFAMNVLLHEAGITSYYISSSELSHAWNMVELDGELYHLDATWDDGSLAKEGKKGYAFFLKNDDQFLNSGENRSHYGWSSYMFDATSTSERFRDWFVHDVSGKMLYKDGYWYYAEENTLKRAKIDGSDMMVVISAAAKTELIDIDGNELVYQVNGEVLREVIE